MKLKHKTFAAIACAAFVGASTASAYTMKQAIHHTLKTNPALLMDKANRYAADNKLRSSYASYLPTVDFSGAIGKERRNNSTTRSNGGGSKTLTKREANITLSQMLFDGFATRSDVAEQDARVAAAEARVVASMQDLSLKAIEAYLEVLRRNGLVNLAKKNLTAHQKIFQQIKLRSEKGVGLSSDLEQARSRMALARTNLMSEQANMRDAEASFMRVVGISPKDLVRPAAPKKVLPNTMDVAVAMAIENHPSLQISVAEVEAAAAQHQNAKSAFWPKVDFDITASRNKGISGDPGKNNGMSAGLSIKYNIFKGGADTAREQEAAWSYEEAKESRNKARREVEQQVRIAWNGFSTARAQLKYFKKRSDSATATRDSYSQQFKVGQRTLLDLLDSESEVFNARTEFLSAQYSELFGRYRVLNSMGSLTKHLGIKI